MVDDELSAIAGGRGETRLEIAGVRSGIERVCVEGGELTKIKLERNRFGDCHRPVIR